MPPPPPPARRRVGNGALRQQWARAAVPFRVWACQVWDLASSTVTRTLVGHQYTVWSLAVDPLGGRLFSASADSTINVWDTSSTATKPQATLKGHSGRIYSLAIHGTRLYSASSDRTVKVTTTAAPARRPGRRAGALTDQSDEAGGVAWRSVDRCGTWTRSSS